MDLGIAGRAAIVCASSKGLGRACATELARAGCRVVINGRDAATAERTAAEIRAETGAEIVVVVGDLNESAVREALFAACPEPDILINNNGGPPPREFEAISRDDILKGVEANMITPILLAKRALPGMADPRIWPHHQHYFGLGARADRRGSTFPQARARASPRFWRAPRAATPGAT